MPLRDHHGQRRSGRGSRDAPSDATSGQLWAVSVAIVLIFGFGVWLYIKSQSLSIETDEVTLCPRDDAIEEVLVVLLDLSSLLSETQQLDVRNQLSRIRDAVPRFGRIELYAVDRLGQRVIQPLLQLCNPGRGDDMNGVYQNPELARRRWERDFASAMQESLDELMTSPESAASPIFEAVQATALVTFDNPLFDAVKRKSLVLVSDLMQNVPGGLRMYEGIPNFMRFERTTYFNDVRANLENVSVAVLYLQRPNSTQLFASQVEFWSQYFAAQGATLDRVLPISGAQ